MRICRRCGDMQDPRAPHDGLNWPGEGYCGDLHDWAQLPPVVVVTRHAGLVEFLRQLGILGEDTPVLAHVSHTDVWGKTALGVLPLHLAAEAEVVVEAQLELRPDQRGRELSAQEVAEAFRGLRAYRVTCLTR